MYFDSIGAFIDMGGHGAFVWAAYFVCFSLLAGYAVQVWREQKKIKQTIKLQVRKQQRRSSK